MKKVVFFFVTILFCTTAKTQNVGIGTTTPNASAAIEIKDSTKGLLIPRMSNIQRDAIISPAKGLLVFVNTDSSFYYYEGTYWKKLLSPADAWSLNGNNNTAGKFIGTLDTNALHLYANNKVRVTIDTSGYLGVNNLHPTSGIHMVDNGSSNSDIALEYNNSTGAYPALLFNKSRGTNSLKEPIDSNMILGGVNFYGYDSTNSYNLVASMVSRTEGDFSKAGQTKAKLNFNTSNGTQLTTKMTILNDGKVGIGLVAPTAKLEVRSLGNNPTMPGGPLSSGIIRASISVNSSVDIGKLFVAPFTGWMQSGFKGISSDPMSIQPLGGKLGIGTIDPIFKVDVRGDSTDDGAVVAIGNSDRTHAIDIFGGRLNDPNPFIRWKSTDPLRFATDNNGFQELMRISPSGSVGIGTESPFGRLDVDVDSAKFYVPNWTAGGNIVISGNFMGKNLLNPQVRFSIQNQPEFFDIGLNGNNAFAIEEDDAPRLTIAVGGNVGIGTPIPNNKLDVLFNGNAAGIRSKSSSGWNAFDIDADNGESALRFIKNGVQKMNVRVNSVSSDFEFYRNGSNQAMRIDNATGKVWVLGDFTVLGVKAFTMDHPLDPENKLLVHAAIESNEVLNVYSGNIVTDANGKATIQLPDYFETINKDFRYQLTVVGVFAQAIVSKKVSNNQFEIATNTPNVEVSWEVTGVRNDAHMKKIPFKDVLEKDALMKGTYVDPEAHDLPVSKAYGYRTEGSTTQQ